MTVRQRRPIPTPPRRTRPWAVSANALLLLLEGVGFLGAGALYLGPMGTDWPVLIPNLDAQHAAVTMGVIFALLAVLALSAALGIYRLAPGAWLTAVLVQGVELFIALLMYFQERPAYAYFMMVYGIVMVLYLHQADVQSAFRQVEAAEQERAR